MPNLTIEGIPVEVQRKKIKHLHLYVKPPDGHVLVTAPLAMADETICQFVSAKIGWLQNHIARVASRPRQPKPEYRTGDMLPLWGDAYPLIVRQGSRSSLLLDSGTAVLTVRKGSTTEQREKIVREFYRTQLKAAITARLPYWERITGLHPSGWQTKAMTTRWGTCNTKTRKLWFAVQLAAKPSECLEYVLLHELLHLTERQHNARFYRLLDLYMPGWKAHKAALQKWMPAKP